MNGKIERLAHTLVRYSTEVEKGQKVLIQCYGADGFALVRALIKEVYAVGAYPILDLRDMQCERSLRLGYDAEQAGLIAEREYSVMREADVFIGINATENTAELTGIPGEADPQIAKIMRKVLAERIERTRWVVLRYPNAAMAQLFGSPTEEFAGYYFDVCNVDYRELGKRMEKLEERLNRADRVRIVAPGTDLSFSIKNIGAVSSCGNYNMPDGEVMTAPVRDSVEGTIRFNCAGMYRGAALEDITLRFEKGKVVQAECSGRAELLDQILHIDENASYVGEFAFGVNPLIKKPMRDILFDEKIAGSIHIALGNCYFITDNGNPSALHWDLVLLLDASHGGGTIHIDDELIARDGLFVPEDLQPLNPEEFFAKEE